MNDHATEQSLSERIRAGDKAACAECIEIHSPAIYRLALRMLGNQAEAEDVTQETFLNAFKSIDTFEWRAGLQTWLHRIAYNNVLMRLRKPRRETVSVQVLTENEGLIETPRQLFDWCCLPEAEYATTEARAELARALNDLPEKLRAVFVLRDLEEHSTEETATILAISTEAVKTRLHRARLALRERLADYYAERINRREETK
ncbi:MAG: sigma-70 family RNA polymerase sigma factor [Chloroflexi bacterium]|nr:sigma-70 family RNA polymerase sigma factor [Chloroflexota bacterium]